jgi:hypothetical protein
MAFIISPAEHAKRRNVELVHGFFQAGIVDPARSPSIASAWRELERAWLTRPVLLR